jgi:hypothetical protein
MRQVNEKKVILDLNALQLLCNQCLSAIEEQQDAVIQAAMRKVCHSCSEVKAQLPVLQAISQRDGRVGATPTISSCLY